MIDKLNDRDRSRLIEKKSDFLTMYDWEWHQRLGKELSPNHK